MKNGEVIELYEALNRICAQKDLKLKVSLGYTLLKNKEKLYPEAKIIYDMRQKILMEYGTRDKNGDIVVLRENIDEVNQKINELMDIDNLVDIIKISFEDIENYELNIEDIEGIRYMIK